MLYKHHSLRLQTDSTSFYTLIVVSHLSRSLQAKAFHSHFERADWLWQFSSCSFTPSISLRQTVWSNIHILWQATFWLGHDKIFIPCLDFIAWLYMCIYICVRAWHFQGVGCSKPEADSSMANCSWRKIDRLPPAYDRWACF